MIDVKGHHVYLHCSAGISRGPTLCLVYLALFMKHKHWNNLEMIETFIRQHNYLVMPNTKVAKMVIEKNKDFQSK